MKTTERILQIIKRDGAVTAKSLSDELSMTTMGARQHLQGLEDDGLLNFEDKRYKVGRPTRHWSLTTKGHEQFADRHGELTIQFVDAIEQAFGESGLLKVAYEREQQTLSQYSQHIPSNASIKDKLTILAELRNREGYMVELIEQGEQFILTENHCPICKAAQRCPALCNSELNVFQRLLGEDISIERTEHIVSGERRCVYLITPSNVS